MNIEKVIISRRRRASAEQKGALLSYLEENINFAHERFECDAKQWKQYWRDFKRNVKSKAAEEKRQIEASGINSMRKIKSLDDYERRAISIMTIDVIDGDGVSQERGFSNLRTVSYQEVVELNSSMPVESIIQPSHEIIIDSPSPNIIYTNTERPRRTGRLNQRRRRTNSDDEIRQYLELEKEKMALKREIFEFQKQNEKKKLEIKTKKADALVSISESLKDLKNIIIIKFKFLY